MHIDPHWTERDDERGSDRPSVLLALAIGGIAIASVVGVFVAGNAWFGTVDELRDGTLSLVEVAGRWIALWVGVFVGLTAGLGVGYLVWRRASPEAGREMRTREWRAEQREAVREAERMLRDRTRHGG
ncbi:MAG: hypothetical protein GEU80_01990 [Dehalococcoidia bacterium]|nr:hypothetical protein [Dehalococcoidia bacterium]